MNPDCIELKKQEILEALVILEVEGQGAFEEEIKTIQRKMKCM